MDFVAIDFETANECRNSACAVGLTRVSNGEIGETDYHLIRPVDLRFEPGAIPFCALEIVGFR